MSSEPGPHVPPGAGVVHLLERQSAALVCLSVCLSDMTELCLHCIGYKVPQVLGQALLCADWLLVSSVPRGELVHVAFTVKWEGWRSFGNDSALHSRWDRCHQSWFGLELLI